MLDLALQVLQRAHGTLAVAAVLTGLRGRKPENHADHDERAFEQPLRQRLPDPGSVRQRVLSMTVDNPLTRESVSPP